MPDYGTYRMPARRAGAVSAPSRCRSSAGLAVRPSDRSPGATEPQHERRATAGAGADADRPALLGHQTPSDEQAQSGAGAVAAAHAPFEDALGRGTSDPLPRSST